MSVNIEAVMISIKKMTNKIHEVGFNSFEAKKFESLIESVPDEYKILYRDIPINIDKIGDLLAYYHYNFNIYFQRLSSDDDEFTFDSDKKKLLFFAEQSRKLIQMLNLIGYPLRLIKYKNEIKSANKIKSKILIVKTYEHGPIFEVSKSSQITDTQEIQNITQESAKEHVKKCEDKIKIGDYSGAITNSRSLVESVIKDIYKKITGEDMKLQGSLSRDWNMLSKKLYLHPKKAPSDDLKEMMVGLISIMNGLSAVRNKMSDSHGNTYKAEKHHAVLVVKTAFTFVEFIYDTYDYQEKHGNLFPSERDNPLTSASPF